MPANPKLAELLARYRDGTLPLEEAAREIEGLRIDQVGHFANLDLGRGVRCGMPEVILAEGKEPDHLVQIALRQVESAGRCVVTRLEHGTAGLLAKKAKPKGIGTEYHNDARVLVLSKDCPRKANAGIVGIITAGTSDIRVAEEARVIAEEMGCTVRTAYDVGAAGIHRLFPALKPLLDAHVLVVCAGREGTLPAVVAGLVDTPVIGVPVSTGYGYMGEGRAALASMLQSCSVVAVVNIDAGFTAGAFAAKVAILGAGS